MYINLKLVITHFNIIIDQNMIKKARRIPLFHLSLCISKSFLDLLFGFRPSVDQVKDLVLVNLKNKNNNVSATLL